LLLSDGPPFFELDVAVPVCFCVCAASGDPDVAVGTASLLPTGLGDTITVLSSVEVLGSSTPFATEVDGLPCTKVEGSTITGRMT